MRMGDRKSFPVTIFNLLEKAPEKERKHKQREPLL